MTAKTWDEIEAVLNEIANIARSAIEQTNTDIAIRGETTPLLVQKSMYKQIYRKALVQTELIRTSKEDALEMINELCDGLDTLR